MHSWSKIIVSCLILLFSSVYSIATAEEADELRLQKLEELLEIYIQENKELKQKLKDLESTKDTAINKPENQVADQLNGTTARARCDTNIKGCSEQDLCAISTFTSSTGKRKWRAGDLKKFADEAKQRGIACGVENIAQKVTPLGEKKQNVASSTTAFSKCNSDISGCSEKDLCSIATYIDPSGNRRWRTGGVKRFSDEAKRRGLACKVKIVSNTIKQANTKTVPTTARARCDANIKGCSKQDLCAISTFTSSTGKRKWRAGDLKKFVDEAKLRGIACGVENAANTKIKTTTKPIATTARARCDANIKGCSEQDLCAISTFTSSTGKRQWRAGDFKKFADEAKQRGFTCGVHNNNNALKITNGDKSISNKRTCKTDIKVCTNIEICKQVKFSGPQKYTIEAQRRGLSCGATPLGNPEANAENGMGTCTANIAKCNEKDLCKYATYGIPGDKKWQISQKRKKFVQEAKRRGLTCGVVTGNSTPKPPTNSNGLKLRYAKSSCQSGWLLTNKNIGFVDKKLLCPNCSVSVSGSLEGGSIGYTLENNKAWRTENWVKSYDGQTNTWVWTRYATMQLKSSGQKILDKKEYLFECNSTSKPQTQKVTQPTKSQDEIIAQCAEPWRKELIQVYDGYPNQRELVEQQMESHRLVLKNMLRSAVKAGHVSRRDRVTACRYNVSFVNKKLGSFPQLLVEDKHLIEIHEERCKNKNAPNCFYGAHMYVVTVKNQGTNRQRRLCYDMVAKKDASSQCDAFILRRGELSRP